MKVSFEKRMETLDLTIRVLNLSPRLTHTDITSLFSYCGTVCKIQISRSTTEGKGSSQSAFVTFTQPYAFQTALLLDGAILADQKICVLPAGALPIPIMSDDYQDTSHQTEKKKEGSDIASKGAEMLKKIENELEEKSRVLAEQMLSGIGAAEEAAGRVSAWLSDVAGKASKFASQSHKKKSNSRNQK